LFKITPYLSIIEHLKLKVSVTVLLTTMILYVLGISFGVLGVVKYTRRKSDVIQLHRPDWKKDVVYLVQFPVAPEVNCIH